MSNSPNDNILTDEDRENMEFIAQNIAEGSCVLFLGAGVNMCSDEQEKEYPKEKRPPTGSELTQYLIDDLKLSRSKSAVKDLDDGFDLDDKSSLNLSRVAQYYELKKNGRLGLARILRKHILFEKEPSPRLCDLAEMPFEYIITTNYDTLYEQAFQKTHEKNIDNPDNTPHIGIYRPERKLEKEKDKEKEKENLKRKLVTVEDINQKKPFVFKIHGDINNPSSMVITDEDYITFVQRMRDTGEISPIPEVFDDALARKSILFIGYRLMDYNLRLLLKTIRWGQDINTIPRNYSIDPYPDHLIRKISDSNYQTRFIISDLWTVVPELKRMVSELTNQQVK